MTPEEWRELPPQAIIRKLGVTYYLHAANMPGGIALLKTVRQTPSFTIEVDPRDPSQLAKLYYLGITLREYLSQQASQRPY